MFGSFHSLVILQPMEALPDLSGLGWFLLCFPSVPPDVRPSELPALCQALFCLSVSFAGEQIHQHMVRAVLVEGMDERRHVCEGSALSPSHSLLYQLKHT